MTVIKKTDTAISASMKCASDLVNSCPLYVLLRVPDESVWLVW